MKVVRIPRLVGATLAMLALTATALVPASASWSGTAGRCAVPRAYRVSHTGVELADIELNVIACPWTMPDGWQFPVHVRSYDDRVYGYHEQVLAWVSSSDIGSNYRFVTLQLRVDRCGMAQCTEDVASWSIRYFVVNDGGFVSLKTIWTAARPGPYQLDAMRMDG